MSRPAARTSPWLAERVLVALAVGGLLALILVVGLGLT